MFEHTCRWFVCMGFIFVIFPFIGLCQTLPFLWSCKHSLISHPQTMSNMLMRAIAN